MFKVTIAKQCNNQACPLMGQMQDKGLPICPECASDLSPIVRTDQRMLAIAGLFVALFTSVFGSLGYGMLVKSLAPADTLKWLAGRVKLHPSLAQAAPAPLLDGWLKVESSRPGANLLNDRVLCESRDGVLWCRERNEIKNGDEAWFSLTPHVENLYVFYRGPGKARVLFPSQAEPHATAEKSLDLPKEQRMRISGAADTETFLIVASRQPVASLAALVAKGDSLSTNELDAAAKPLASQPETMVVFVEVPHS